MVLLFGHTVFKAGEPALNVMVVIEEIFWPVLRETQFPAMVGSG